jgi:thiazole synthase
VTVAVRRLDFKLPKEEQLMSHLDTSKYKLLPNTAACFSAEDAIRIARMGRELGMGDWVKLEVLGDKETLLPDPVQTLEAAKTLTKEGFEVLCYTSDDPILAQRLRDLGVVAVMPAGAPIGSGLGILNSNNIKIILEKVTEVPVIVDAGVGTASDVTRAMELGAEGVLLNTGIFCGLFNNLAP